MRAFFKRAIRWNRYLVAVFAGLLLSAGFPPIGLAGLAWLGPGLIVIAVSGKGSGESFRIGFVAGLAYYLASLHWLLLIPYRWMGIPFGPALGWLALSGYLALYPAAWAWSVERLRLLKGPRMPVDAQDTVNPIPGWGRRTIWCVVGAATWVGMEMLLARMLTGFPWDLLGVSQYQIVPLIQIASYTGVYGVGFLVVWVSLALLSAGVTLVRNPERRSVWIGEIAVPVLAVALIFSMGLKALRSQEPPEVVTRVTLVQPSIPQTLIWDSSKDETRFENLLDLSEEALNAGRTDLMIWPEAAVPKLFRYDRPTFEAITSLARKHQIWMIIGADDAEPRRNATGAREADYYNSSFLISPEGKIVDNYRKRNLVVFGEYVPLEQWLPFLSYFTPIQGGFSPGEGPKIFNLSELHLRTSVLICFEDVFPHLAREVAREDTDFLVNITNNGWFGEGAAQWQHAATSIFRAVENQIPLVRSANNGLTCWIDQYGRIRQVLYDRKGRIYGKGFMTIEVPTLGHDGIRKPTFYNRYGDLFGWTCFALSIGALAMTFREREKNLPRGENSPGKSGAAQTDSGVEPASY